MFWKWLAGLLEDQSGSASSKRMGFYWALALFTYMIVSSVKGRVVQMEMFYTDAAIILTSYGLITSEFFKKTPFGTEDKKLPDVQNP